MRRGKTRTLERMIVARSLFYLSLVATLFMLLSFTVNAEGKESSWPWLALAMVVAFLITVSAILVWPRFLTVAPDAKGRFVGRTVAWTFFAYLGGAAAIIALAHLLMPPHYLSTEAALTAYGLAVLLPLTFSPAVGLALAWCGMRSNSTPHTDARASSALDRSPRARAGERGR
jgi:hypothetical protein